MVWIAVPVSVILALIGGLMYGAKKRAVRRDR
jgi:hypothetical protein